MWENLAARNIALPDLKSQNVMNQGGLLFQLGRILSHCSKGRVILTVKFHVWSPTGVAELQFELIFLS